MVSMYDIKLVVRIAGIPMSKPTSRAWWLGAPICRSSHLKEGQHERIPA